VTPTVELGSLVAPDAPICYGILMPGADMEGGVPVVKVRNYDHSGIDVGQLLRAAPDIEAPYRRSRLKPGDILMSIRGTTGVIAVVPPELSGANITQDTARIRVDAADRDYLYQVLHSPSVRRQIRLHTIGQAVKGINIGAVRQLQIPWPSEVTRRLVARILGDCDSQIRNLGLLSAAKRIFKRGLMQTLLSGRKRFLEYREVPWKSSRLGDHVAAVTRRNTNGSLRVLTASGEHGLVDQRRYFNRSVASADLSRYYLLKNGEFAYNRSAMNGYPYGATKRLDALEEGALSTLYLCFAIDDHRLDSDYLKHIFDSGILNRQLRPIVRIGGRAHGLLNVSDEDYFSINIPFPPIEEQRRIANVLNGLNRELNLIESLREQVEAQKRALLARLLDGDFSVLTSS
jgi:type I restriction enzyme S subunit